MTDTLVLVPAPPGNAAPDAIEELPLAYFEMDAQGVITRANRVACSLFQREREGIVGKSPWEFMAFDEIEMSREDYFSLMQGGKEPPAVRRALYTRNGEFRTYEMYRSLIRDAQGKPTGLRHAAIDVTEAQIAHEQAHQARLWLESVLESVAEAVVVTDSLGFVRYVNPAAEELSGWKSAELFGKVIEKGLPLLSYVSADHSPLSHSMALEKRCKGVGVVLNRMRKEVKVEISTSPILDKENGFTIGVVRVLRHREEK